MATRKRVLKRVYGDFIYLVMGIVQAIFAAGLLRAATEHETVALQYERLLASGAYKHVCRGVATIRTEGITSEKQSECWLLRDSTRFRFVTHRGKTILSLALEPDCRVASSWQQNERFRVRWLRLPPAVVKNQSEYRVEVVRSLFSANNIYYLVLLDQEGNYVASIQLVWHS